MLWRGIWIRVRQSGSQLSKVDVLGITEDRRSSSGGLVELFESVVYNNESVPWDQIILDGCSSFQCRVLRATAEIPWGDQKSYGDVARAIDSPQAAQAVGQALGDNPFPILIPCHRVIRSDGTLGGYQHRSDNSLKRKLLNRETDQTSFLEEEPGAVN